MAQVTTGIRSVLNNPRVYETFQKVVGSHRETDGMRLAFRQPSAEAVRPTGGGWDPRHVGQRRAHVVQQEVGEGLDLLVGHRRDVGAARAGRGEGYEEDAVLEAGSQARGVQDGQTLVTDGPFATVKEALNGYLVDCIWPLTDDDESTPADASAAFAAQVRPEAQGAVVVSGDESGALPGDRGGAEGFAGDFADAGRAAGEAGSAQDSRDGRGIRAGEFAFEGCEG